MGTKRKLNNAEKSYYEALKSDRAWEQAIKTVKPIGIIEKPTKTESKKSKKDE